MYSVTLNLFEGNRNRQQRVAVNFSSDVSEDFEKFLSNKPCGKVQSAPPELQLGDGEVVRHAARFRSRNTHARTCDTTHAVDYPPAGLCTIVARTPIGKGDSNQESSVLPQKICDGVVDLCAARY